MTSPDQYRSINSYYNAEDEPVSPLTVTVWDLAILVLECVAKLFSGLSFLTKAHNNRLVERKAVEMEMRRDIEAIR